MKKRQPTKTPPKKSSCRNHREQEHEQKQDQLPLDLPDKHTSAPRKPTNQRCRSDKPTSQFGCSVWQVAIGKISPINGPAWQDEAGQSRWWNKPLPMRFHRL